jgi:RNA polymerase sigma-70 factor (ECF subfamily)
MAMTGIVDDDAALVARLREHDEAAFAALVDHYAPAMLRVARGYVSNVQTAEDVVQETWIAVMNGIAGFEARSSLRTWLFTVLINIAKKRGVRDRRIAESERMAAGVTVDPDRFRPADAPDWPGHWKDGREPSPFPDTPEGSVLGRELMEVARCELDRLPERQRTVVSMRDLLGMDSVEVCQLLGISVANQRVLLHRGRASVRQALEGYLADSS